MMTDLMGIVGIIKHITLLNVLDILIVAYIIYRIYMLIKETRAEQLVKGLVFILIITKLSDMCGLVLLYWIIKGAFTVGIIAIVIIFQPELRKALEHLGRSHIITKEIFEGEKQIDLLVNEISIAAGNMSKTKTGALMIIEQETGLNDFLESGIKIDAQVSAPLLENIFVENTPLHDGAVIMRRDRIYAAACVLPLTAQPLSKELGTRHRAAVGVTENADCISVVVSEETGNISLALNGKITRNYTPDRLKIVLSKLLKRNMKEEKNLYKRVREWLRKANKK